MGVLTARKARRDEVPAAIREVGPDLLKLDETIGDLQGRIATLDADRVLAAQEWAEAAAPTATGKTAPDAATVKTLAQIAAEAECLPALVEILAARRTELARQCAEGLREEAEEALGIARAAEAEASAAAATPASTKDDRKQYDQVARRARDAERSLSLAEDWARRPERSAALVVATVKERLGGGADD